MTTPIYRLGKRGPLIERTGTQRKHRLGFKDHFLMIRKQRHWCWPETSDWFPRSHWGGGLYCLWQYLLFQSVCPSMMDMILNRIHGFWAEKNCHLWEACRIDSICIIKSAVRCSLDFGAWSHLLLLVQWIWHPSRAGGGWGDKQGFFDLWWCFRRSMAMGHTKALNGNGLDLGNNGKFVTTDNLDSAAPGATEVALSIKIGSAQEQIKETNFQSLAERCRYPIIMKIDRKWTPQGRNILGDWGQIFTNHQVCVHNNTPWTPKEIMWASLNKPDHPLS